MKTLNMMRLRRKLIRKLLFGMVLLFSVIGIFQIRGKTNVLFDFPLYWVVWYNNHFLLSFFVKKWIIASMYFLVIFIQYTYIISKTAKSQNSIIPYIWFNLNWFFKFFKKSFVFLNFQFLKTTCIFVELLVHVSVDFATY